MIWREKEGYVHIASMPSPVVSLVGNIQHNEAVAQTAISGDEPMSRAEHTELCREVQVQDEFGLQNAKHLFFGGQDGSQQDTRRYKLRFHDNK
ncbi:unnamed protein product [Lota lota]